MSGRDDGRDVEGVADPRETRDAAGDPAPEAERPEDAAAVPDEGPDEALPAAAREPDDWEFEDEPDDWPDAPLPTDTAPGQGDRSVWLAPKPAAPKPPEPTRRRRRRAGGAANPTARPPVQGEDGPTEPADGGSPLPGPPEAPGVASSASAPPTETAGEGSSSATPPSPADGADAPADGDPRPAGGAPSPGRIGAGVAAFGAAAMAGRADRARRGAAAGLRRAADALAGSGPAGPSASPSETAPGPAPSGTSLPRSVREGGIRLPAGLRPTPLIRVGPVGRIGAAASLALFAAMLLWAQVSVIGGAVIGSGEVVVRGQPKEVQSLDGGVVAAILTEEGARVEAGEVLMRLDPTLAEIELDIREGRLADAVLRQRRLEAEYAGADSADFAGLPPRVARREIEREIEGQKAVFAARRAVLESQRDGLAARAEGAEEEIAATEARITDLDGRLAIARDELERTRKLVEQGLAARAGLAEAEGRVSALTADLAGERVRRQQADAAIREARLAVVQAEQRFRETAVTELRETSLEREQLLLDIARLEKDIARTALVAPASGIVHDLRVATEGGVVGPGERVMQIVPVGEGVEFAVRIDPRAIDEVHVGQPARLVLPAFAGAGAPELYGRVAQVPPAARTDPQTGLAHYLLSVEVPPDEIGRLGEAALVPGMPVEAFLATAERSVLAYLLGPLTEQFRRAFREG